MRRRDLLRATGCGLLVAGAGCTANNSSESESNDGNPGDQTSSTSTETGTPTSDPTDTETNTPTRTETPTETEKVPQGVQNVRADVQVPSDPGLGGGGVPVNVWLGPNTDLEDVAITLESDLAREENPPATVESRSEDGRVTNWEISIPGNYWGPGPNILTARYEDTEAFDWTTPLRTGQTFQFDTDGRTPQKWDNINPRELPEFRRQNYRKLMEKNWSTFSASEFRERAVNKFESLPEEYSVAERALYAVGATVDEGGVSGGSSQTNVSELIKFSENYLDKDLEDFYTWVETGVWEGGATATVNYFDAEEGVYARADDPIREGRPIEQLEGSIQTDAEDDIFAHQSSQEELNASALDIKKMQESGEIERQNVLPYASGSLVALQDPLLNNSNYNEFKREMARNGAAYFANVSDTLREDGLTRRTAEELAQDAAVFNGEYPVENAEQYDAEIRGRVGDIRTYARRLA